MLNVGDDVLYKGRVWLIAAITDHGWCRIERGESVLVVPMEELTRAN